MTIWTQEDIDSLKSAIAGGVLTVRYDGPPARSITYQNLSDMRSLLASMVASVSTARRVTLAKHSKGLR